MKINRIYIITIITLPCIFICGCLSRIVEREQEQITKSTKEAWASKQFDAPKASGAIYNSVNAYSLARVCSLIWDENKSSISAVSKMWGGEHLFVDLRSTHSQYLLFGNGDFTVLAFRATQTKIGDFITVLKYRIYDTNDDHLT